MVVFASYAREVRLILGEAEGWNFVVAELQNAAALIVRDFSTLAEILVQNELGGS